MTAAGNDFSAAMPEGGGPRVKLGKKVLGRNSFQQHLTQKVHQLHGNMKHIQNGKAKMSEKIALLKRNM